MAEVDAELLRWEQSEWAGIAAMGTVNLVEFWKVREQLNLRDHHIVDSQIKTGAAI
jgi:hypothetical protein